MSTLPPSDLPGPVPAPFGPTEGVVATPGAPAVAETVIAPPIDDSADSIVGAPELKEAPVVAASGQVVLAVTAPWYTHAFDPSIAGCPVIDERGTVVSEQFADQVIAIGAANGVTIAKR